MPRLSLFLCALLLTLLAAPVPAGQRARLGVGMTILPACPSIAGLQDEGTADAVEQGEVARDAREMEPDLDTLRRCMAGATRVVRHRQDTLDHPPPGARRSTQVLLIEF